MTRDGAEEDGTRRSGRRFRVGRSALILLLLAWVGTATYHVHKPLPDGLEGTGPMHESDHVRLLTDDTWTDDTGRRQLDHAIFDRVLTLIDEAEELLVLDMFLFNDFAGDTAGADMRPLSREVADALREKQRDHPDMAIIVITDPLNTLYGGIENPALRDMEEAGVEVIQTRLEVLRDSNPLWSGLWRLCCQWLGEPGSDGWLPNPVGEEPVPLRSLLALLNFKANHRKTLIADTPRGLTGLVTSANPHDASSAHDNVALEFTGPAARDLLETERAVARFSRPDLDWPRPPEAEQRRDPEDAADTGTRLRILTEAAIRDGVLSLIQQAEAGDRLDMAMFYLAHRAVVEALIDARRRGVEVRVLLDPNLAAFGREKGGLPNQAVADELERADVTVRWCRTRGEQCHGKFVMRHSGDRVGFILGSANMTRRNLDNLNLETGVHVRADPEAAIAGDAVDFFEQRWNNPGERHHSVADGGNEGDGWLDYWRYRFMEATGLSTF